MNKEKIAGRISEIIEKLATLRDELTRPGTETETSAPEKFDKDHPYDPAFFGWVDLGLPSGRLWADRPAPGYYQFNEAVEVFGEDLPRSWMFVELRDECKWTWDDDRKGYDVKGPNGNTIFLPALGYQDFDAGGRLRSSGGLSYVGSYGFWWSFAPYSKTYARSLYFSATAVYPLYTSYRASGYAVLPSRE